MILMKETYKGWQYIMNFVINILFCNNKRNYIV